MRRPSARRRLAARCGRAARASAVEVGDRLALSLARYASTAVWTCVDSVFFVAVFAESVRPEKASTPTTARMPRMAMTTRSSMSVKPFWATFLSLQSSRFMRFFSTVGSLRRGASVGTVPVSVPPRAVPGGASRRWPGDCLEGYGTANSVYIGRMTSKRYQFAPVRGNRAGQPARRVPDSVKLPSPSAPGDREACTSPPPPTGTCSRSSTGPSEARRGADAADDGVTGSDGDAVAHPPLEREVPAPTGDRVRDPRPVALGDVEHGRRRCRTPPRAGSSRSLAASAREDRRR